MSKDEFLVKRLLDNDYSELKDDIEGVVANKIHVKINDKKKDVIASMNKTKHFSKEEEKEE